MALLKTKTKKLFSASNDSYENETKKTEAKSKTKKKHNKKQNIQQNKKEKSSSVHQRLKMHLSLTEFQPHAAHAYGDYVFGSKIVSSKK